MDYQVIASILSAIIAALTAYIMTRKKIFSPMKLDIAEKQLYKVYLPLFTFLEPYLYQKVDFEIVDNFMILFNGIKQNHYELIDSDMLNAVLILKNSLSNDKYNYCDYEHLCYTLDKLFEKKRKLLFLPTRKLSYRINANQFNSSIKNISDSIITEIIEIFPIIITLLLFFILYILISPIIKFISNSI